MSSISATTEQWVDSAPDGVMIVDRAGVIQLTNRHLGAMFGYERDELVGQLAETLIPERLRSMYAVQQTAFLRATASLPTGVIEIIAKRNDGSEFPANVYLSSFETSQGLLVSAVVRDVSSITGVGHGRRRPRSPRGWRQSWNRRTTRSSARQSPGSSPAGTPGRSACTATPPMRSSATACLSSSC